MFENKKTFCSRTILELIKENSRVYDLWRRPIRTHQNPSKPIIHHRILHRFKLKSQFSKMTPSIWRKIRKVFLLFFEMLFKRALVHNVSYFWRWLFLAKRIFVSLHWWWNLAWFLSLNCILRSDSYLDLSRERGWQLSAEKTTQQKSAPVLTELKNEKKFPELKKSQKITEPLIHWPQMSFVTISPVIIEKKNTHNPHLNKSKRASCTICFK